MSLPEGGRQAGTSLRMFWLLTSASAVSELGNTFLNLAVPLTIMAGTGSSVLAALSLGVQYLPFVASPALATLIDGYERRRVFLAAELTQCALVALIPLLLMAGQPGLILLLLLPASCASVISNLTVDFSLLPALVPPDGVTGAYSKYGATTELARCAGPALAGIVLATLGSYWALWINAATFLLTALVAAVLPRHPKPSVERGFLRMQREGFRSFRQLPGIGRLTLALSVYNLGAGAVPIVMVLLVHDTWGWPTNWTGVVIAAGAASSALGAWLGGRVRTSASLKQRIGLWFGVCAASCAMLLAPWTALVVAGFCGLMAGEAGMNVASNEFRFRAIPQEVAGRTNAVMRAFILGAAALSSVLLGWSVSLSAQALRFTPALLTSALAAMLWIGARRAGHTTTAPTAPEVSTSA